MSENNPDEEKAAVAAVAADPHAAPYQKACLKIAAALLLVWFSVSFGCGIIFREWLDENAPNIGTAPFGFWMAQQGSIICFVILLVVYAVLMNRLDIKHGYNEDETSAK